MKTAIEITKSNAPVVARQLGIQLGEVMKRVGKYAITNTQGAPWIIIPLLDFFDQYEFIEAESANEFRQVRLK